MPRPRINMTGQKYGKLTVLMDDPEDKNYVICRCDCGNMKRVNRADLRSGHTKSCGCIEGKRIDSSVIPNGTKYGYLTVIGNARINGRRKYLCQCVCGKVVNIYKHSLERGIQSCGCMQDKSVYGRAMHEKSIERLQSLVGKRRGRLECIAVDEADPKHITVKCDCGTVKKILKASFTKPSSNIYSCGCLQREVQRLPKHQRQAYIEQVKAAPAP